MHSRTILLFFLYSLFLFGHAPPPDTAPDTELRPIRPLSFDDVSESTQTPITSLRYPIELPRLPISREYDPVHYDYGYVDDPFYTRNNFLVTEPDDESSTVDSTVVDEVENSEPDDESSTVDSTVVDGVENSGAQQERLENSNTKNCISWGLVLTLTFLLCIVQTLLLG